MIREARHLTQAALAELCGVSRVQVALWESDINRPSAPKLQRL
ncbi:MAG: Helix-turn-helix domain, partial [Firmicutes bacterium]|nr:Helix-turn-helix domain [Bacillota bacterium]